MAQEIRKINGVYMGSQEIASTRFAGDANIKAYYKGDNVNDSSTGGYNLTNNNTVTFTAGKFGNAFTLNGSNQYLTMPKAALPLGTNVGSISMWIKFGATSGYMGILMNDNATEGLWLYYDDAGIMKFFNRNGTTGTSYAWTRDTNWHHWVFVRDGTNSKIYLDGNQVATAASCPNFTDVSLDYFLGAYNVNGTPQASWYFNGQIDDVLIRSAALTSDEIYSLYKTGIKKLNGVSNLNPELESSSLRGDANLVSYWRMEGDSSDSVGSNEGTDTSVSYSTSYGKFGQGGYYNVATPSYTTVGNSTSLAANVFSINMWLYKTSTGVRKAMMGRGDGQGYSDSSWFCFVQSNETVNFNVFRSDGAIVEMQSGNVPLNTWTMATFVLDASYGYIYINGVLSLQTARGSGTVNTPNVNTAIGEYGANAAHYYPWNGYLDDIVYLNRALTSTEISNLYNTNIKKYGGVSNV